MNEPGTLCWNELTTRAVEESKTFYAAACGLTTTTHPHLMGDYYEFHTVSGRRVAGMMPMVGDMWPADLPNHWMVYFAVDDVDAAAKRCTELGGNVAVSPTDIPPGRFSVLNHPQGGFFSVIKLAIPPGT